MAGLFSISGSAATSSAHYPNILQIQKQARPPRDRTGAMSRLAGKSTVKLLFIRPPHHYWPIINDSDNFLVPLAYPALAAWLRHQLPWLEVEILDCCVEQVGFQSLARELKRREPDVVAIGEKTLFAHDALRAFDITRETIPDAVTVGGGHIFSHEPEWALSACDGLDYCIRFEGERAFERFLRVARDGGQEADTWSLVWFAADGERKTSPLAPIIEDLDTLPPAAFDLVPMRRYSPMGMLYPQGATIQRSRGCVDTCRFCSWIAMENRHAEAPDGSIVDSPLFRSKSVEKVMDEVDELYRRHGVRYLFWVDATWNVDDRWLQGFSEQIQQRRYDLGWWAFTRYDMLPRQHQNGTLKAIVDAGLRHVLVGVERAATGFDFLDKHRYSEHGAIEAFHILRDHYPEVFRQGTFITGIRSDTPESIRQLLDHAFACDVDFAAFHVCTPFPGTPLYREAVGQGWLEEHDFTRYDMFSPIMGTEHMSRAEVARWTSWAQRSFVMKKPLRYARRMFSRHRMRRRLHRWFFLSIQRVLAYQVWNAARGRARFEGFSGVNKMWKPDWYDS